MAKYTREGFKEQVIAKLSDRYNVNSQDITEDSRLKVIMDYRFHLELGIFRYKIADELGMVPIDDNQVKFWRTVKDIIDAYEHEQEI